MARRVSRSKAKRTTASAAPPKPLRARRGATLPVLEGLAAAGVLNRRDASDLLAAAAEEHRDVGAILRERYPDVRVPAALAHPFIELIDVEIDQDALAAVPIALAQRHGVLPIRFEDDRLLIAMSDPTNIIALDDLTTASRRELAIVLADQADINEMWIRLGNLDKSSENILHEAASRNEADQDDDELDDTANMPMVRAINHLIAQAVQQHASDLHIEPQEDGVRVRFRLDGVLHDYMQVPKSVNGGMSSRLKVMANMDIAERRIPQDGRITVPIGDRVVDLRVATVPSVWGEEVILRILDRSTSLLTLGDLGFLPETLERYQHSITKPHGAILVVGPTGSGKSTTLYSTLSAVNQSTRKIITVEDPVEFRLRGVSQIHVNPKAGLTFASALRSILRSDPDVVMVGEIRDTETAKIAIEAAMTGHLVFSTLHTNDAPSALTRLIDMQVEPFLVASSVECVLAQRLARKLCLRCREAYVPSLGVIDDLGLTKRARLYRAVGCKECAGTGYRGRVALVELMVVTEEIQHLAADRRTSDDIRRVATLQGMRSLRDDGLDKVRMGVTSLEEVLRVVEGLGLVAPDAFQGVMPPVYPLGQYAVD